MAEKIGNEPVSFIRHIEVTLNTPNLLTVLCLEEEHVKHIQAIQLLSGLLDAVAKRVVTINDPELLDIMFKMKLLKVVNEGEHFEDI